MYSNTETQLSEGSLSLSSGLGVGSDVDIPVGQCQKAFSDSVINLALAEPPLILNSFLPVLQQLGSALVHENGEYVRCFSISYL